MTTDEVTAYYGSKSAIARALSIKQPSVSNWGEYPPADRQMQLQILTGGKLRAEPCAMDEFLGIKKQPA